MRKIKPETAYNLKNIFGSLFSNQCAIEAGKSLPLWAAFIVFALGCFLPVIPTMVNTANSRGDAYVTSTYNYSFDKQIVGASLALFNEDTTNRHDFVISDNGELTPNFTITSEDQPVSVYFNSESKQNDLEVFYTSSDSTTEISETFANLAKREFVRGTTTKKSDTDPEGTEYYSPNLVFLHKQGMAVYLFKHNTTTAISTSSNYAGDWKNTAIGTHLLQRIVTVEGYGIPESLDDTKVKNMTAYIAGSFANFKAIMCEGYLTAKNQTFAMSTGIYTGIYAGLTLLLGLLVFLLTRGKKNLNRYLTILTTEKIVAWTSVAPGILSLALGFALPNFAVMFFILFEGMRVMWMSMRQLAPTYQA